MRLRPLKGSSIGRVDPYQSVRVYSYLEHEGIPFIVMERVQGVSLVDAIIDQAEAGESFDLAGVYSISLAVAGALKSVHQAGIAHRDVKPGNVMLCEEERFVLMDFGLFLPEFAMESQSLISGSPPYMAPGHWLTLQRDREARGYLRARGDDVRASHRAFAA